MATPKAELRKLLLTLFRARGALELFVADHFEVLEVSIDFERTLELAAKDTVQVLHENGCVTAAFFDLLRGEQLGPAHEVEIDRVRALWFPTAAQGVDPLDTPRAAERPFVNRDGVRRLARDILAGQGPRVIVLTGGQASGKSYCKYLFAHLESVNSALRLWVFDFAAWSADGGRVQVHELADGLASQMQLNIPAFQALDAQASRRTLKWLEAFGLQARQLRQTWCLFFDSMHKVPIPHETREFIESLADYVAAYPAVPVRVVLPGVRPEEIKLLDLRRVVREEPMVGFTRLQSRAWISAIAAQEGRRLRQDVLDAELDALFLGIVELQPPEQAAEKLLGALDNATEATG
ncbi:MAG: hypothetical protein J5I93_22790 [Pirellulaceae bacterium]|nr:hypothetical protein [Pirellulaceae bacterium]